MKIWLPTALLSLACASTSAHATSPSFHDKLDTNQQKFYQIYKHVVETDTTHSAGDNTKAAQILKQYLVDAGFASTDIQIFEPFPRKGNLVLRIKGTGGARPMLLLGHLDVVEAKRSDWKTDPFKLKEDDGFFTARGAIDDKAMVASMVSALIQLRSEGFTPSRDIILALTADEERLDVPSNGVRWLVENHRDLLDAEFGLNEGASGVLRDNKPVMHNVQVAEKMYSTYEISATDKGGHSARPTKTNPIYAISQSLDKLNAYEFPVNITAFTTSYYAKAAQFSTGQQAADMAEVGSGKPSAEALARLSQSPTHNSMLRTTCVATLIQGGHASNALPQSANATINCRILPADDPAKIEAKLRELTASPAVAFKVLNPPLTSPESSMREDVFSAITQITQDMWPGVPVIPTMSGGASDSRYLRNIGIPVYGVTGVFRDQVDSRTHGVDERAPIDRIFEGREFLYRLIKKLAQ